MNMYYVSTDIVLLIEAYLYLTVQDTYYYCTLSLDTSLK